MGVWPQHPEDLGKERGSPVGRPFGLCQASALVSWLWLRASILSRRECSPQCRRVSPGATRVTVGSAECRSPQ